MQLPKNLILVRHGQSEANIVQKNVPGYIIPENFGARHDSHMRLTDEGREQARLAGLWIKENLPKIDKSYVSPHIRTRETAANLRLNTQWEIDDLWRERDWGEYGGGLSPQQQKERFPHAYAMKKLHPWYWKPVGGETLATGVRYRAERVLENIQQLNPTPEYVLGVTHGEFITTMRFILEHTTVEQWAEMDKDKKYSVKNCSITHYTRINPITGEEEENYGWVRMINTTNPELSPDNGSWRRITRKTFTDEELLQTVNNHALLLKKNED